MYSIDEKDKVVELKDAPQSSVGAPLPLVLCDERRLLLAYLIQDTPSDWDGSTVRIINHASPNEPVALVEFSRYYAYSFGPPNDEAFSGHPLADRGLEPYGVFQIEGSSWIRQLERMNSVHPYHKPERYERLRHYIFAFHDSTFECVAEGYIITEHGGHLRPY
jgi:hypothetical protein